MSESEAKCSRCADGEYCEEHGLKTLKDIPVVNTGPLRFEAIKWIKKLESKTEIRGSLGSSLTLPLYENTLEAARAARAQIEFIKTFFNITEEALV